MKQITLTTADLTYNKETGILARGDWKGAFPRIVVVESTKTTKVVRFFQDCALAMDKEFWDGEEMWYFPEEKIEGVKHLVLSLN